MVNSPSVARVSWIAIGAGTAALLVGLGLAIQPKASSQVRWQAGQRAPVTVVLDRHVDGHLAIPDLKGKSLHEARVLLLHEGWSPRRHPVQHGDSADVLSGNGPAFWEKGYHELVSCSGSGAAPCRFEYQAPDDDILVVVTAGAESPDDDFAALVDQVFLDKKPTEAEK